MKLQDPGGPNYRKIERDQTIGGRIQYVICSAMSAWLGRRCNGIWETTRHNTTDTTDFCPSQLDTDLLRTCYGETAGVMDFGLIRDKDSTHSGYWLRWRSHRGLGVRISPLFENMGLVIRANLHINSEGGVCMGVWCNYFGDSTVQKV